MHTNIHYGEIYKTEAQKQAAALKDIKDWCSKKQLDTLKELANHPTCQYATFSFACGFAGIQGYPVTVAFETWRQIPDMHVQDYREHLEQMGR